MDRPTPSHLPIDEVLADLVAEARRARSVVLKAPTGAGKTARVAPALLDALPGGGKVLLLEPRRVAARAAARRIAFERGGAVGDEVGYHVRFDRKVGPRTRLVAMTVGIFLAQLQDDPFLEGVAAVVFDEFHERSLDADLALAMARKAQREVRPDLVLVVMSATLDAAPVAGFLGNARVLESKGRSHPVEIRHRPADDVRAALRSVPPAVRELLQETPGDVLVFLPGVGEIRRARRELEAALDPTMGVHLAELYGDLPAAQQDAVLRRGPGRKVVLATNVAESSVTIEHITGVVDTGLARVLRLDAAMGFDRLELTRISRASAEQRAGRAGRTAPGLCIRLWSTHDDRALRPAEEPEVRRVDLGRALLALRTWGEGDAARFDWFEAPDPQAIEAATRTLDDLGALDGRGLSPTGALLARLPLPPRLGRLLVEGRRLGVLPRAALAAALLSERDPLRREPGAQGAAGRSAGGRTQGLGNAGLHESDLLARVLLLERFAASASRTAGAWPELSVAAAEGVLRVARELERTMRDTLDAGGQPDHGAAGRTPRGASAADKAAATSASGTEAANDVEERFLRSLLAAFPDRVALRREPGSDRARMVGGRGLRLAPGSAVATAPLFVAIDVDAGRRGERSESMVRLASAVEREWLPEDQLVRSVETAFDPAAECVTGFERWRYRDLVLEEKPAAVSREAAGELLAEHAAAYPAKALDLDDDAVLGFLARVRSLAEWMPELALPAFDEAALAETARQLASRKRSFAEIRREPLLDALRQRLTYEQLRLLDHHAPEAIAVPSGSNIQLQYSPGRAPVLAVRIQEVFGMRETPRVAAGRVPVLLHLLAPNHRPEQVTEDLASFWTSTYPVVRKELRARYPRHAWPEDPRTAPAERRPARRKPA